MDSSAVVTQGEVNSCSLGLGFSSPVEHPDHITSGRNEDSSGSSKAMEVTVSPFCGLVWDSSCE